MKMKLAVCTTDENYASRFINYFNIHYADRMELSQFSDVGILEQYLSNSKPDVCLVDEDTYENLSPSKIEKFIFAVLADDRNDEIEGVVSVFKYQKADIIYKELLNLYADSKKGRKLKFGKGDNQAIIQAFCSPAGGSGATTIAISYAIQLAKTKRVLYLDMQQCGNSDYVLNAEGHGKFDDVIFAVKSKRGALSLKIESLVRKSKEEVNFFATCDNPLDLQELTAEDMEVLLRELSSSDLFEYIIIDIDSRISDIEKCAMDYADHLILVTEGNENCRIKMEKYLMALDTLDARESMDVVRKTFMFYNKFSNKSSRDINDRGVPVIGGASRFEGVQMDGIVGRIAMMDCFKDLLKIVDNGLSNV